MSFAVRAFYILMGLLVTLVPTAQAQVLRGSINGTVKDESGAVLPGVSITVTSPALQVPQLEVVSGDDGIYTVTDLPIGVYRVSYALAGFSGVIREGIQITSGFAARIDPVMKVGAVEESVTVSGQSPVIDVTTTRGGGTVSADTIQLVPVNKTLQDVMLLAPGAQVQGPPQTASVGFRLLSGNTVTYGLPGHLTYKVDGIDTSTAGEMAPDFSTAAETDVKTYGGTAEARRAGISLGLVVKSGGNDMHGRLEVQTINKAFNSTNVDDALRAQGISDGDAVNYHNDIGGDLGGRIVRDKLWFYVAIREQRNERTVTGYVFAPGQDGRYGTPDDIAGVQPGQISNRTIKLSYQMNNSHKFAGLYAPVDTYEEQANGARFVPFESTTPLHLLTRNWKLEWQGTLSPRFLATFFVANGGYRTRYHLPEGAFTEEELATGGRARARLDRATGQITGPTFTNFGNSDRGAERRQLVGSLTSVLGSHTLQVGADALLGNSRNIYPSLAGDYQLVYDTISGRPLTPTQINIRDLPTAGQSNQNYTSAYASDEWRVNQRLTANVGLRWDYQHVFNPKQFKVLSRFGIFPSGEVARRELGAWNQISPRLGVAFDLTGSARTVVKATYGQFYEDLQPTFGIAYNLNGVYSTYTFRWNDQDGNSDYTPGEVNLNLNGPDFVSVSGPRSTFIEPDLKLPTVRQVTATIEHELRPSVAIRANYVHYRQAHQLTNINQLRPYSAYNIALNRRDPGGDGILNTSDDGDTVTIYDYDPAYRGADFVRTVTVNADRGDRYHSLEGTLAKRRSSKWGGSASVLATKVRRWIVLVPQSPNDDAFPLAEYWDFTGRAAFSYELPGSVAVSALYQVYSGLARQRTVIFRAADPDGGPPLRQELTITRRMEPAGQVRGPVRGILNLRGGKRFAVGSRSRLNVSVDALNALNTNAAWGAGGNVTGGGGAGLVDQSGPTYNFVTRIPEPRAYRFAVSYDF